MSPAPRSGASSVTIEGTANTYSPPSCRSWPPPRFPYSACATNGGTQCEGATLNGFTLSQVKLGTSAVNHDGVQITVFLFGTQGQPVPLPDRTYTVQVQLVPYLVTAATVPDAATRRTLLGCDPSATCEGVIVDFNFDALLGGPHGVGATPLSCSTPGYDFIDDKLLSTVEALTANPAQTRKALALDSILKQVGGATEVSACAPCAPPAEAAHTAHLVGLDVASDGDLAIALALSFDGLSYTPAPFPSSSSVVRLASDADWGVGIDTGFALPLVTKQLVAKAQCKGGVHIDGTPSLTLQQGVGQTTGGIILKLAGHYEPPVCNAVPFTLTATAQPQTCLATTPAGTVSSLGICVAPPAFDYSISGLNALCIGALGAGLAIIGGGISAILFGNVFVDLIAGIVGDILGNNYVQGQVSSAVAGCRPIAASAHVATDIAGNLYPSGFFLSNMFFVAGRSDLRPHSEPMGCSLCVAGRCDLCNFPNCAGCGGPNDSCGNACPAADSCTAPQTCVANSCRCPGQ